MKNLLYILILFLAIPFTGLAQNDTIPKNNNKTPSFNNQIDLDVQFLGISFSFKKRINKTQLFFGLKTGFGFIVSSPYGNKQFMENIYIQPIINLIISKPFSVEIGPRLSAIINEEGRSIGVITGLSVSFFCKIWKLEVGTRTQMSYVGENQSNFKSPIIISQEVIILRIPIKNAK